MKANSNRAQIITFGDDVLITLEDVLGQGSIRFTMYDKQYKDIRPLVVMTYNPEVLFGPDNRTFLMYNFLLTLPDSIADRLQWLGYTYRLGLIGEAFMILTNK